MGKQKDVRMRRRGSVLEVSRSSEQVSRGFVPYTLYDTALTDFAYGNYSRTRRKPGNKGQLGDLFGDIMGAVVGKDNWDARPDWMKNIKVKPDPAKLFTTAAKVLPPKLVGKVVGQANQAGFDMYYNTPAGSIPVTPEFAEGVYGNYPAFLKTREVFGSIPIWVYALGAGGILLAFMMRSK